MVMLLTKSLDEVEFAVATASDGTGEFVGKVGWARFAKGVILTQDMRVRPEDLGEVLSAEWLELDGRSCRLFPDPQKPGSHRVTIFPKDDPKLLSDPFIVDGAGAAHGKQPCYQIYWRDAGDGRSERAFDVFRGFAGKQGSN